MLPWYIAGLIANAAIIYTENVNRHSDSLAEALPLTWWSIAIAQVCLFLAWNGAPHWFIAWTVFSLGNTVMRVGAVYATDQPIGNWHWVLAGIAGMVACQFIVKQGLR